MLKKVSVSLVMADRKVESTFSLGVVLVAGFGLVSWLSVLLRMSCWIETILKVGELLRYKVKD
jgi:hypothetical protein